MSKFVTLRKNEDPLEGIRKMVADLTKLVTEKSISAERATEIAQEVMKASRSNSSFELPGGSSEDFGIPMLSGDSAMVNDYLFIGKSLLGSQFDAKSFVKKMVQYRVVDPVAINKFQTVTKAMAGGTAGSGAEWIPTGFSSDLIQLLHLQFRVCALHPRFTLPMNPYTLPVAGSDAVAYLAGQNTSDNNATSKLKASTPGTGSGITYNAKKLATRILASEEITEDSVVPILEWMRKQIVTSLAIALESATINGDTSGTHQDTDVTGSDDARKTFMGYRKLAMSSAKIDLGASWTIEGVRGLRQAMGKYGVNPNSLAYITSINAYFKMLNLKDSAGNSPINTLEKYGPNAVILSGELARIDNIPIIVSEWVRQDLNATGVFDNVTKTKTEMFLTKTDEFSYGDRRDITIKTFTDVESDQEILVGSQRVDFQPLRNATTEPIVAVGYNI